jgi:hypothetical protein
VTVEPLILGENASHCLQPTGQESLVERWILHKLNAAATEINTHLTDRNFMMATTSVYSFWLYELCDVYIVRPPVCFLNAPPFNGRAGGNEAHEGRRPPYPHAAISPADTIHLS